MAEPKPGIKTSELWTTIAVNLVMVVVLLGFLPQEDMGDLTSAASQIVAGVVIVINNVAYIVSRARLKGIGG